jgi:imidazolonepropionase-like amidohydrolase
MRVTVSRCFALRAARVFDGEHVLDRPTVLIDGDTVVAASVAVPASVPVVDLGAATLLPGLIDCHQHLCFDGNGTLEEQVAGVDDDALIDRARASARRALGGGVTTLRDLGDRSYVTLGLREDRSLPTILAAGPPITRTGGHCWFLGGICAGEADLREAVRARAERHCDVVKVMVTGGYGTPTFPMWQTQFGVDELRVIVEEAHRAGLPVAAHCHGVAGIEYALDVGVDSIEHCTFYTAQARPEPNEALLQRLAASGVPISATFGRLPDYPQPPNLAANRPILFGAWRRLKELGATLVAGTDAGIGPGKPHDVLAYALGDLIDSGDTLIGGLRALTGVAAQVCGVADHKGRLSRGFDADIIAVNGNPLTEPNALLSITAVWRAGDRVR